MATQARHLFSLVQRVRDLGNRMSRPGMANAQRAVELDFRQGIEISLRDLLGSDGPGHVALG